MMILSHKWSWKGYKTYNIDKYWQLEAAYIMQYNTLQYNKQGQMFVLLSGH